MKREKVRKNSEFRFIYKRGKSSANHLLVLYIMQKKSNIDAEGKFNRLGISVSKKVGNSVVRSRVRRLISESYRLNKENLKLGYDFVVIARNLAKDKSYAEIEKSLINLLKKAGLCKDEKNTN